MRERDFIPIAEYVGPAATNTGLYSFAAPSFAVYVVLGEDDGRPNLVITVRGTATLPPGPGGPGSGIGPAPTPSIEAGSAGPDSRPVPPAASP
jgi:hypothetical protein